MIRIPNASPVNLFTNFETNCTCYFHPNVLIYALRNRIAYLARNHKIFYPPKIHQINNSTHNNKVNENSLCSSDVPGNLRNEVNQILYSLLSCIDYINPQSTCTILLSLIKLRYDSELIRPLVRNFKFSEASPKSISLFFLSVSKLFINPQILGTILEHINNAIDIPYGRRDIICILSSITRVVTRKDLHLKRSETDLLTKLHSRLMTKLSNELENCNINELTIVLESMHSMNYSSQHYQTVIECIVKHNALITFDNVYQIFQIINSGKKLTSNPVKRDKHGVNNKLLLYYLDKLTINEIVKIINDFRIYTTDQFVLQFSNLIINTIHNPTSNTVTGDTVPGDTITSNTVTGNTITSNNVTSVTPMNNLNVLEVLKYYNRRYETSVTREYYVMNQIRRGVSVECDIAGINEVSNLCGYIYQLLHSDHDIQRCIINKQLILNNYQHFFQ
ncbi:hypothetical protein TpMuguga_04g00576 [Theileria parva strain Muguga]|uniref:Uncharacterized protein n=1 Tax=Theileria parva TaxID=5875 RepID=Q4N201_THEPA|nr:uncharacterized protein TpMuguga_04g00576 [Theileria parva strain Muguga]EAN31928.1 hypothetical protein TpMuguga_04g00576 [Theileria parva strain Muguga]|eukprot:XP_764211.1 hypothetical protein [Theileria parva strain Muguga]